MKLFVLDTETSGLPEDNAQIVEIAWMTLAEHNQKWEIESAYETYVQFTGVMDPRAQASHHIPPVKLTAERGAITREKAITELLMSMESDSICVAHNSEFDSKFIPEVNRWICTYRVAKKIWPEAPGHSNQVLRYWLGVTPDFTKAPNIKQRVPHQALYDVATTTGILQKMLERHTPAELFMMANTPTLLKTIQFGKHKGMDFVNIPRDYLAWLGRQDKLDPDVRFTIDSILRA